MRDVYYSETSSKHEKIKVTNHHSHKSTQETDHWTGEISDGREISELIISPPAHEKRCYPCPIYWKKKS